MTTEERRALLDRAITTYGAPAQMDMAVEEMAELTKALCKVKRVSCAAEAKAALENAVEELADVQIMLDQLRIIFGRSTAEIEEDKLRRLLRRINSYKESNISYKESNIRKWLNGSFKPGDWWSRTVNTEANPHEEGAPEK